MYLRIYHISVSTQLLTRIVIAFRLFFIFITKLQNIVNFEIKSIRYLRYWDREHTSNVLLIIIVLYASTETSTLYRITSVNLDEISKANSFFNIHYVFNLVRKHSICLL